MKFGLFFLQFILSTGLLAAPNYTKTPTRYPVSTYTLERWLLEIHEGDELWLFAKKSEFLEILYKYGTPKDVVEDLLGRLIADKTKKETVKAYSFYAIGEVANPKFGFLTVPLELKMKIPKLALSKIYKLIEKSRPTLPSFDGKSVAEVSEKILELNLPMDLREIAVFSIVETDRGATYYIPPEVWGYLPAQDRQHYINQKTHFYSHEENGYYITKAPEPEWPPLQTNKKEKVHKLPTLFHKLRLPPGSKPLMGVEPNPFSELLYIRTTLGDYEGSGRSNCFSCSMSVYFPHVRTINHLGLHDVATYIDRWFDPVDEDDKAPLDLIVYRGLSGNILHTSTYITKVDDEDIVYSKNGLSKFAPYVLESLAASLGHFGWREPITHSYYRLKSHPKLSSNEVCSMLLLD